LLVPINWMKLFASFCTLILMLKFSRDQLLLGSKVGWIKYIKVIFGIVDKSSTIFGALNTKNLMPLFAKLSSNF